MNKKDKELVSRVLEDFRSDDVDRSWLKGKWEKYTKTYLGVEDEEMEFMIDLMDTLNT